jgi:hypothetical protein
MRQRATTRFSLAVLATVLLAPLAVLQPAEFKMLLAAVLAGPLAALNAVDFHVAPNGSDANPGTEASPFATLERARDAVRQVNRDMTEDIVVVLHGGTYQPDGFFFGLGPADSGTGGHNVIYRARAGETPIISGGAPITGWQPDEQGRWKALTPARDFRQLYVNNVRATRARGAVPAGLTLSGEDGYTTTAVSMADWKRPSDLEICYVCAWAHTRCKVRDIRREGDNAVITMRQPQFTYAKTKEGVNIASHADEVYLENALELLDEPGEWYLDEETGVLYYLPQPGEDMTQITVVAPTFQTLVFLAGDLDQPVHNIQFEGIRFEYGKWSRPSRAGFVDVQANFVLDEVNPMQREGGLTAVHNQHWKSEANVVCSAARSIRFERCVFARLGGAGINLDEGSGFIEITGNVVYRVNVPMNYNNLTQNRKATCREYGNWFTTQLEDLAELPAKAKETAARAGLAAEFRDLRSQ